MRLEKNSRRFTLLMVLFLLFTACGGGGMDDAPPTYVSTIREMNVYIDQQIAESRVAGLSIALVDDQRIVWANGFGDADVAKNIRATADTHFEIGSNSKTFAGVMIAQLVERGRLHIDDPLTHYLADFSIEPPLGFPAGGPVTIRTMLTHHSGIPGDVFNGGFTLNSPRPGMNRWLRDYLRSEHLNYPSDFMLSYSNTAVALLADVIAAASGSNFDDYAEALFHTLGMDQTSFSLDSPKVASNLSKGYMQNQELGPFYCNLGTSGSIISTANDMAKYLKMIMAGGLGERGRVMAPATLDMALTKQPFPPLDLAYHPGFLWFLNDPDLDYAGRLCWHNGGTMLMMSHMAVLRDHKLAVVVLSNTAEGGKAVADIAKRALKLALEEKTGIKPPPPFVPEPSPVVAWDPAVLDSLAGIYVRSDEGYLHIVSAGGGLHWTEPAGSVSLVPRANGRLSAPDSQATEYEFKVISGREVLLRHSGNRQAVLAERYTPVAIPPAWSARLGIWDAIDFDPEDAMRYLPGGGNSYKELRVAEGVLLLDENVIQPVDAYRAFLRGLGRNMGGAVQVYMIGFQEELQHLGVRYRKR